MLRVAVPRRVLCQQLLSSKHVASVAVTISKKMSSILDSLTDKSLWLKFYEEKLRKLSKRDAEELFSFVESGGYMRLAEDITSGGFPFGLPKRKYVNKLGTGKKRIVYEFARDESFILKFIANKLSKYDGVFSHALFSFRKSFGVKSAVCSVLGGRTLNMYCYKADVSDYFNSIDTDILLADLEKVLSDDPELFRFFSRLLTADKAIENGAVINVKRGAMAGTAVAPFFANVYLAELDKTFCDAGAVYARYSDDIIVFAPTQAELERHIERIRGFLSERGLKINPDKEKTVKPNEKREFLGLSYADGKFDLSNATEDKIKGKISRKARALYRWRLKKGADGDRAVRALFKRFNRKFYEAGGAGELTWSRWFFPVLTTDVGLKRIDDYLLTYARYLATGSFGKRGYTCLTYEKAKSLGFKPLVAEYWKYIKTRND